MVTGTRLADVLRKWACEDPGFGPQSGNTVVASVGVFLSAPTLCGQGIRDHPPEW